MAPKQRIQLANPWHLLATGFGSGMFPWIPGTAGSLTAIPFWYVITLLPWQLYFIVVSLSICFGIYCCHQTAKDMGIHDHGCIVWDEFIGMWITLMALPVNNKCWVFMGFLLFRALDIWKPWPINWVDRKFQNGIGIIMDDIVAGIVTASILHWGEVLLTIALKSQAITFN